MISDEELAAIEARAKAAAPGPWAFADFEVYPSEMEGVERAHGGSHDGGCDQDDRAPVTCSRISDLEGVVCDTYGMLRFAEPTGQFIAHAREDVPRLVEEVRRLRGIVLAAHKLLVLHNDRTLARNPDCFECQAVSILESAK